MFWKFNNLLTTSHIETLLEKEDVTLHELMDEDDILQECKAQNRKLIDFIVRQENMEEMVRLITVEPTEEVDEKIKYKYPNTSCELLTSDVSQINDALAGSESLVIKLYSFLESEKPLNPLLASFFSKVMGLLITRKSEMIFEFLKSREDFIGTLLHHIGTSAIMDLLLRLLTCVESPEIRRAVIEWLNEKLIIEKLVGCIVPEVDEEIHCNAAQSLCDIIRLGREQLSQQDRSETDPLLNTVELEETVTDLLSNMLDKERNESVIVNGLSVIQTLLEFRKHSPEGSTEQIASLDAERLAQGVSNVLLAITPRLKDLHSLLVDPPKQKFSAMPTSIGVLEPPLGNTRLQIARLVTALVLANTHAVNLELANLGTIGTLIDLFFQYVWNNFLHTLVSQCINTILFNSPVDVDGKKEHPLLVQLFSECKLLQKSLDIWEENEQQQSRDKGRRRGYMGHLTKMLNDVVHVIDKGENADTIKEQLYEYSEEDKEKWEKFVNGTLSEVNKANQIELVGGHPLASSSEDEEPDFRDIPFPQDAAMQQAFSDYQLQQMTSNFIDQFGFNEEEFAEQEEKIDSPFTEKISSIDFNIQASEDSPNASMFEQACNERIQQFDDNDSDEDIWEEKEITFSPGAQPKRAGRLPETREGDSDDSTDSEEELDSPKRITQQQQPGEKMDVDHSANDAWSSYIDDAAALEGAPVAMDTSPWNSLQQQQQQQQQQDQGSSTEKWAEFTNNPKSSDSKEDNWADFSNIADLSSTDPGPRSSSPVAMDTTEANSRPSAYLARSAPPDLATEVQGTKTDDIKVISLDGESSPVVYNNKIQEEEVSSTSDEDVPTSPLTPNSLSNKNQEKSNTPPESSVQTTTSDNSEEPTSSTPDNSENHVSSANSSSSTESQTTTPPPSPSSQSSQDADNVPCSSSPAGSSSGSGSDTNAADSQKFTDELLNDIEADDLSANFDFLTGSGLMRNKSSADPAVDSTVQVKSNGPVDVPAVVESTDSETASSLSQVEDVRAQAKDILEKYDNALSSPSSSSTTSPSSALSSPSSSSASSSSTSPTQPTVQQNGPV